MDILAILFFTLLQQTTSAPEIILKWEEKPTYGSGEIIHVSIALETDDFSGKVKLLPLELQGLRHIATSSNTFVSSANPGKRVHSFEITIETLEAGNGTVGEFQVEFLSGTGNDSDSASLATHPGFSVHITRQLSLAEQWPWLLFVAGIIATGTFAFLRIKNADKLKIQKDFSPEIERKERLLKELKELRIRAEWSKAVDLAFSAVLAEIALIFRKGNKEISSRLRNEDLKIIAAKWPDFPAIYRLGEEVRYGGYEPNKRESVFISDFLGTLYSHSEQENDKLSGENT